MKRLLIILLAALSCLPTNGQVLEQLARGGYKTAYELSCMGQSNFAGPNTDTTAMPSGYAGPQRFRTAQYTSISGSAPAGFSFQKSDVLVNAGRIYNAVYPQGICGPEQALLHDLQDYYQDGSHIFYDKLAFGGYAISEWKSGGYWYTTLQHVYEDERTWFAANGYHPKELPVIWIQGEADVNRSTSAYQADLESIIDNVRSHSNDPQRAFIFQKLSTYQTDFSSGQRAVINDAFDNIVISRPNCYVFDPSTITGLTMDAGAPGLHYSAASDVTIGHQYFTMMKSLGLLGYNTPVLRSAAVGNLTPDHIILTYNKALDPASILDVADYTISPTVTISSVIVSGNTVDIGLVSAFASTDVITISGGAWKVRDLVNNSAKPLTARQVTNNVTGLLRADDFNRANSTSTMGFLTLPITPWNYGTGTWGISSNKGYCVLTTSGATVFNSAYVDPLISDYRYEVDVTLAASNSTARILFRYVDDNNFIAFEFTSTSWAIFKRVSGSNTTLSSGSLATTASTSYRWRITTSGNGIGVSRDAGSGFRGVGFATESFQNTATKVGLGAIGGASFGGNVLFDNLTLQ